MKKYQNLMTIFLFVIVCTWFLTTVFVDFFAVPPVFRTVSSRDEAALLGITLFSKFNIFECIFLAGVLFCGHFSYQTGRLKKFGCLLLTIFPVTYILYFTPSIRKYNALKASTSINDPSFAHIQAQLDFFHKAYVRMDAVKLLILLFVIGLLIAELYKVHVKNRVREEGEK